MVVVAAVAAAAAAAVIVVVVSGGSSGKRGEVKFLNTEVRAARTRTHAP